jgi:hypothetical protein
MFPRFVGFPVVKADKVLLPGLRAHRALIGSPDICSLWLVTKHVRCRMAKHWYCLTGIARGVRSSVLPTPVDRRCNECLVAQSGRDAVGQVCAARVVGKKAK